MERARREGGLDLQRKEGKADFIHLGYIPVGGIGEKPYS